MLKPSANPPSIPPRFESLAQIPGRWWVAHTKSRVEKRLCWDLLRRDIGYFLPLIQRAFISGGRKRLAFHPLFSSYVFFCGNGEDRSTVLRTNRVARTLDVADQKGLVAELAAIERVLRHCALEPYAHLPTGEPCRIISGVFRGIEGTVVRHKGRRRIVLQVSVIGQGAVIELDGDFLEFRPRPLVAGLPRVMSKHAVCNRSDQQAHLSAGTVLPERVPNE